MSDVIHTDPNPFAADPKAPREQTLDESKATQEKRAAYERQHITEQRGGAPLPEP